MYPTYEFKIDLTYLCTPSQRLPVCNRRSSYTRTILQYWYSCRWSTRSGPLCIHQCLRKLCYPMMNEIQHYTYKYGHQLYWYICFLFHKWQRLLYTRLHLRKKTMLTLLNIQRKANWKKLQMGLTFVNWHIHLKEFI